MQLNDSAIDVKQKLANAFKILDTGSVEGVSVQDAFSSLQREGISQDTLRAALDALTDDGSLYTTIDENHYKSTQ